jgi:hypothetical protein
MSRNHPYNFNIVEMNRTFDGDCLKNNKLKSTLTTFVIAAHEPQSSIQLQHSRAEQEDGESMHPCHLKASLLPKQKE